MLFNISVVLVIIACGKKRNVKIFGLMCRGGYLCSFAGGLWSFAGGLWRFVVVCLIVMEENNGTFLVGCDALVHLAEPMHKKYFATFVWGHPFSTYVSCDRFFNPSPQLHICTHFGWHPSIAPVAYALNGWPISHPKKQIRTFEYRITEIQPFEKKFFTKK